MWRCRRSPVDLRRHGGAGLQRRPVGVGRRQVHDLARHRALARVGDAQLAAVGQTQHAGVAGLAAAVRDRTPCGRAGCRCADRRRSRAPRTRAASRLRGKALRSSCPRCQQMPRAVTPMIERHRPARRIEAWPQRRPARRPANACSARTAGNFSTSSACGGKPRSVSSRSTTRRRRQAVARMRTLPFDQRRQRAGAFGAAIVAHRDAPLEQAGRRVALGGESARRD